MSDLKTQPTDKNVTDFINNIDYDRRQQDANILLEIMSRITGKAAVLWGDEMIGFGQYQYIYKTGRKVESPTVAFSPDKQRITIHIMPGFEPYEHITSKLGKYKTSVNCLYINKLSDIKLPMLEKLIKESVQDMQDKYECL